MPLAKLLPILLTIAFAALPAATRAADSIRLLGDTVQAGGQGGSDFRVNCPPGQVLVGVDVTAGKDINSISPRCGALEGGEVRGETPSYGTFGRAHDKEGMAWCDPDVIEGMYVQVSRVNLVHHVELICRNLSNGQTRSGSLTATEFGSNPRFEHGGEAARTDQLSCGSGAFAIGLFGGAGTLVDRLGLVCGTVAEAAPPPPPPPPEQPAPVQAPPQKRAPAAVNNNEVNNDPDPVDAGGGDDDDGGNGGGDGGNSSANTDTTIYDQPGGSDKAYLSAGDPVSIVQCGNPDNWCQINKPTRGWVWGPELDR